MRRPPCVLPYQQPGKAAPLTTRRLAAIERECALRRKEGDDEQEIADWRADQLARHPLIEHLCYTNEAIFNSEAFVAAFSRRLRKWHRTVGRPVAGEGFEDVLAASWADLGLNVLLAPRSYDGADTHVELENQWVAVSMKSEALATPSRRTIRISSLAKHNIDIQSPGDCVAAITHAIEHLYRYERMIYLRSTVEHFPSEPENEAHRYTLLEIPKKDIVAQLGKLHAGDFESFFADPLAARERNTFRLPVTDKSGKKLFSVTVSRRPPKVSIGAIDMNYCEPIASYWTEPIPGVSRLDRSTLASGPFRERAAYWYE